MNSLLADCLNLLNAYLRGDSRKNELYMGKHLEFFLEQMQEAVIEVQN